MRMLPLELPDALLVVILVMLAYFIGHVINELGMRLEPRLGAMPKSWVHVLQNNPGLARNLNEISEKVFGSTFLLENGAIDADRSDIFYDQAFNILEVNEKLEKIRILQSQYVFFRNAVVVSALGLLCFGTVLVTRLIEGYNLSNSLALFALFGMIFSGIVIKVSRHLSIKRRTMKMSATLHNFYAFYISETKLKK